jgi:hypothetical protein
MDTRTRAPRAHAGLGLRSDTGSLRRFALAAAGPALIVVAVLIALRGVAFLPRLSDQHPDLLSFWLPRSCLLGRALADGRVPLWNPFEMAGTPFAADPQSGWLYLPSMALSWLFGCGGGLRALIVLNPMVAGVGLWWFLRKEGLGLIAATAGGLSLGMAIAASIVAISLPFAGMLAWTPLVLVGASGYLSTQGWRRLGWLALAAFAWGQVASAHLSHGLVMATGLVVAYLVARVVHEVLATRLAPRVAAALCAAFLAFLPLASLAILVPRFDLLARSSLAGGYAALEGTLPRIATAQDGPVATTGVWSAWPLALASTPGGYVGAVMLLCLPFALRDAARRYLVIALGVVGVTAYLLTSTLLVGSAWFRSAVAAVPFGDVYLHNPSRFRYLAFLIVPALGAIGVQSLLDRRPAFAEAMRWIGAGLAVFLALPLLAGADPGRLVVFALASAAVIAVVWALAHHRRWAPAALCGILALELLAGALWSSAYRGGTVYFGLEGPEHPALVAAPLRWPAVDLRDYLEPGPIARALRREDAAGGRYLAYVLPDANFNKAYLFTRDEPDWPALLIGRSILFEVPDALGYSPVQLPRYWSYIRATNDLPVFYNAAALQLPTLRDLRLLGVRYLIVRDGQPVPPGISGAVVETEGAYRALEVSGSEPRVSVVPTWRVVPGADAALGAVLDPAFDPAATAVLEEDAGVSPVADAAPGSASYAESNPEDVRVRVDARAPSIVVIRNAWDEGWSATVDGRPSPVLRTDHLLQGVAVPTGRHEIRLTYRDPWLGRGFGLSAVVWLGLGIGVGAAAARSRRRRRRAA